MEWLGGICGLASLALFVWARRKPRSWPASELQRLRRTAEMMHREQVQPFE